MDVSMSIHAVPGQIKVRAMTLDGYAQAARWAAGQGTAEHPWSTWLFPLKAERAVRNLNRRFFGVEGDEDVVAARLHILGRLCQREGPLLAAGCVLAEAQLNPPDGLSFEVRCGHEVIYEEGRPGAQRMAIGPSWETYVEEGSLILLDAPRPALRALAENHPAQFKVELLD